MKKPLIILIALVVIAGAWYLGSPLFIDKEVDEPLVTPDPFVMPTDEELATMSQEELNSMENIVLSESAKMPEEEIFDPMPEDPINIETGMPTLFAQGQFMGADSFHQGSGTASLYNFSEGNGTIRFEDFRVTNGPDLRVLLSRGPEVAESNYIELGKLKGNVGNQNYGIPTPLYRSDEFSDYTHVIIYCKPFHVVFAVAELNAL